MEPAESPGELRGEELAAIVREVRDRVRARYPQTSAGSTAPLADLVPLVEARDAAEAKMAAIGTVNPRRGGPVNALIQAAKRVVARALDWHVREQIEFNRNVMVCLEAATEAFNELNRALATETAGLRASAERLETEAREMADVRHHWAAWRPGWEHRLAENETRFLRAVADLEGAFQHRSGLMESSYRELVKLQHQEFTVEL